MCKKLIKLWKNRPIYKNWEAMPSFLLFTFFALSSIVALYWGYILKITWPLYYEALNDTGYNLEAVFGTLFMLAFAFQAWFFACVAKRTRDLVCIRLFESDHK